MAALTSDERLLRQSISEILRTFDKGILDEDIIVNVNVTSNRASKYWKQKLIKISKEHCNTLSNVLI